MLSQISSEQISFLSIDMNCAEPEVATLRDLWPRLVPGAVVLLDDYGGGPSHYRQKNALNTLSQQIGSQILAIPTGQGMIVKQ